MGYAIREGLLYGLRDDAVVAHTTLGLADRTAMAQELKEVETEVERAETACDGVELLTAFCAIENRQLRKAVKRVVLALSGDKGAPWIDPDILAEATMLLDVLPTAERSARKPVR